jgi:hypothetical protein
LNQLVLPDQQFLECFSWLHATGLLQAIDFLLQRRALSLVPKPLQNLGALRRVMDVRLTFARNSSYELGFGYV